MFVNLLKGVFFDFTRMELGRWVFSHMMNQGVHPNVLNGCRDICAGNEAIHQSAEPFFLRQTEVRVFKTVLHLTFGELVITKIPSYFDYYFDYPDSVGVANSSGKTFAA